MTDRISITLRDSKSAVPDLARARAWIGAMLNAGHRLVLEVKKETRSDAANRLLHATLGEIAAQLEWAGKKRSVECWKRLTVAAWLRARGEHVEILPAIDGHGVDIVFQRTSKLSRAECSELQEFVFSWGADQGVRFPTLPGQE